MSRGDAQGARVIPGTSTVLHASDTPMSVRNKRKSGDIYLEWLTITAITDEAGEVKHYVGMFSDITPTASDAQKYT